MKEEKSNNRKTTCRNAANIKAEEDNYSFISDNDRCVMCGQYIPEGTMVCPACIKLYQGNQLSTPHRDGV